MLFNNFIKSGNIRLDQQLQFTAELDKMTAVMRRTLLIDKSRRENDAEHSWHIAVMALLFEEYAKEKVNIGHAVKLCVVHDLVEIYAGDTYAYDSTGNKSKAERESKAADKLFSQIPQDQGKEIRSLWEEFDAENTPESKYAACLDRIQPFLHNVLTDGQSWQEHNPSRTDVSGRMKIIKDFMPEVYSWIEKNLDNAVKNGWLKD